MSDARSFEAILEAAAKGEPFAVESLYASIYPHVMRFLRAREPVEADDLASDVWLDVATGLASFQGDERGFRAWVFTIARRRIIDLHRRRARRPQVPIEDAHLTLTPGGDVEDEAMERISTADALALIGGLPEEQADILLLRIVGGLSVEEVASIIGKRSGAIRVAQHRALKRLAKKLDAERV